MGVESETMELRLSALHTYFCKNGHEWQAGSPFSVDYYNHSGTRERHVTICPLCYVEWHENTFPRVLDTNFDEVLDEG